MNNVSVHIFFCVSIAIDVLEPGTDLSIEYVLHRSTERQLSLHLQDIYSSTIGRHRSNVIDPRNKKERKEVSHFRFPKERLISTSSTSNGLNRSVTPTKTLTIAKQFPLLGSSPFSPILSLLLRTNLKNSATRPRHACLGDIQTRYFVIYRCLE